MQHFEELKQTTFSLINEQIHRVINGEIKEVKFPFAFPRETIVWLENELGFEVDEDQFDTNGWDWDWGQLCSKDGINYEIGGSGWGGSMSFRRD